MVSVETWWGKISLGSVKKSLQCICKWAFDLGWKVFQYFEYVCESKMMAVKTNSAFPFNISVKQMSRDGSQSQLETDEKCTLTANKIVHLDCEQGRKLHFYCPHSSFKSSITAAWHHIIIMQISGCGEQNHLAWIHNCLHYTNVLIAVSGNTMSFHAGWFGAWKCYDDPRFHLDEYCFMMKWFRWRIH